MVFYKDTFQALYFFFYFFIIFYLFMENLNQFYLQMRLLFGVPKNFVFQI